MKTIGFRLHGKGKPVAIIPEKLGDRIFLQLASLVQSDPKAKKVVISIRSEPQSSENDTVLGVLIPGKMETLPLGITITRETFASIQGDPKAEVCLVASYVPDFGGSGLYDEKEDEDFVPNKRMKRDLEEESSEEDEEDSRDESEEDEDEEDEDRAKLQKEMERRFEAKRKLPDALQQKKQADKKQSPLIPLPPKKAEPVATVHPSELKGNAQLKHDLKHEKTHYYKELPMGLKYQDLIVGIGQKPRRGRKVVVQYTLTLENGKKIDSSGKKGFAFRFGTGEVIKGWDLGIASMQVGGERHLIVPPHLGYGDKRTGNIPAKSTLHFDVKLLEVS